MILLNRKKQEGCNMAHTYNNPSDWQLGTIAAHGDIFKVNDHDATNNIYVAGDFYIAMFDGVVDGRYYPPHGKSNSNWTYTERKWISTTSVSVALIGNPNEPMNLYGNGLCMLPVRVYMTAMDNGTPSANFTVSDEDMENAVTLVDLATGKKYKKKTSPPKIGDEDTMDEGGYYCATPGEFVIPSGTNQSNSASSRQFITLYVFYKSNQSTKLQCQLGCIIVPKDNPANTVYNYNTSGTVANGSGYIYVLPKKKFIYGQSGDVYASVVSNNPENGFMIDTYYIDMTGVTGMKHVELIKVPLSNYPCGPFSEDCFYIHVTTSYLSCGVFTDTSITTSTNVVPIPYIRYNGFSECADFKKAKFRNHDKPGVCVAFIRWWKAGIRPTYTYSGWGDDFRGGAVSFYDEYGNKCKVAFTSHDENSLDFTVLS